MKNTVFIILCLILVGCGGKASQDSLKPEWILVSQSCGPTSFDASIAQCINSEDARSIESLVQLEGYVFGCFSSGWNPDLQSDNDLEIQFSSGGSVCVNVYQR